MDFLSDEPRQAVRAVPGTRPAKVPVWILGSSLFGAQLAAMLGLPYAFASHFAPGQMMQAIEVYRASFKPSAQLAKPYVMLGFNVFAADTDEEAALLATSMQQAFVNLRTGRPSKLPPPGARLPGHAGAAGTRDAGQTCCHAPRSARPRRCGAAAAPSSSAPAPTN
jgi:luciferase family oxidoreductase group 1